MQELKIEYLSPDELTPYENNARKHTSEDIEGIKKSILDVGFLDPIGIWGEKNIIVEGHGRQIASKELHLDKVPCIRLDQLTDEQRREYTIRHNRSAELSGWNFETLEAEIAQLEIDGIDMSDLNFNFDSDFLSDETEAPAEKTDVKYFDDKEIEQTIIEEWRTYASVQEFASFAIDRASAMHQFNRLCQGYEDGYNISLLFNPHRLDTETNKSKSIFYGFCNDDKYQKQFARYIVEVANRVPPFGEFYKLLSAGSGGYQYVNEFQPYLARDIYKKYVHEGDKVLNPCAGWGGRLLGIASCLFHDIEYVETDPQTDTFNGLVKLKQFLRLGDNFKQYNLPFEELPVEADYFDFVFTSPPYFDTERYSTEDTQSYKRYNSFEIWRDKFLKPMIDKILYCMKHGGKCLLNVGNVQYKIDTAIDQHLDSLGIRHQRVADFKIGGAGIGERTGEGGEPFILFGK